MFKNITARFNVVEDTAFKAGKWNRDRSNFIFKVRRYDGGAFRYGDYSSHCLEIENAEEMPHYYDTRYAQISTDKEKWVKYWKDFIEEEYMLKVELADYEEELVKNLL